MRTRPILSVLLIIAVLVSVAGASAVSVSQADDGDSGGSDSASGSGDASESGDDANYTRLYVEDRYKHLRLKPGETDSVTVTVENVDEEEVEIDLQVVAAHPGARPIPEEWVTIDASKTTLAPDEEVEITVEMVVPEDADVGGYRLQLALTDERITYPGRPPRPVHGVAVNLDVWREPTVRLLSGRYLHTQVEGGESFTHEIVIENTGDEAVPLSPEFEPKRNHGHSEESTADRSWFEIDAPNEIKPGEKAIVKVTITPPADAERGHYNAELDLGIKDPTRDERDTHWQRVRLNFQVWKQPDEPFTTTFQVSHDAEDITLKLAPRSVHYLGTVTDTEPVSFDVEFVAPNGSTIEAERVEVTNRGFVDLTGEHSPRTTDNAYAVRSDGQEFVYRVENPNAGTWGARIMPHNTIGFRYEIVRTESE